MYSPKEVEFVYEQYVLRACRGEARYILILSRIARGCVFKSAADNKTLWITRKVLVENIRIFLSDYPFIINHE